MTTLPVKKFEIWRRLAVRLGIEDQPPGGLAAGVSKQITLTLDISDLLRTPSADQASRDLTAAAGNVVVYFTVPAGQRWNMKRFLRENTVGDSALTFTIAGALRIATPKSTAEVAEEVTMALNEGDAINMRATGDPADADISLTIFFDREDSF